MQIYLGDIPLDYSGIKLGNINITDVDQRNLAAEYANNFINATGITNPTQQLAILNLCDALLTTGIWYKMYAVYPFIGGTATTHKYNLINPADTNAAFRLNFSAGWTHNSNGVTGNGTSTWANTFFNPTTSGAAPFANAASLGVYCRNNTAVGYDISSYDIGTNQIGLISRYSNNFFYAGIPINGASTIATSTSLGLSVAVRDSAFTGQGYKNTTQVINASYGMPANVTNPLYLGNTTSQDAASNRNYAFAFIGNALTAADVTNYYNLIQAYETELGRQV